jgi:putative ABC transport system permease protein
VNTFRLILRNLLFFRGASIAVTAGMAVATAVLAGALMVGDSVKGSLADLVVQRLGKTDYALVGGRLFEGSLASRIAPAPSSGQPARFEIAPALILNGGASVGEGKAKLHVGDVQILATGAAADGTEWVKVDPGHTILNAEAGQALGLKPGVAGDALVFTFPSLEPGPRDAIVAKRDRQDAVADLRAEQTQIAADSGGMVSLFNLAGGQRVPRNAWVNLNDLQEAVSQPRRANALLAHDLTPNADPAEAVAALNKKLREVITLGDYGLEMKPGTGEATLSSRSTYLDPPVLAAARKAAADVGATPRLVAVNLVNAVVLVNHKATEGVDHKPTEGAVQNAGVSAQVRERPLVLAPWVSPAPRRALEPRRPRVQARVGVPGVSGPLRLVMTSGTAGGEREAKPALHYIIAAGISSLEDGPLKDNEIAFNEFTAKQLGVNVGDTIRLDYFKRQDNGELVEVNSSDAGLTFHVAKILPMTGLGADRTLTPTYKGMTDAPSVSDWRPPRELHIDEKLAEKDNDAYWKKYKAAPRVFVSLAAAQKMWGGVYGDVTSVRVPADKADAFAAKLRDALDPAALGLAFRAVKAQQVAAASSGGAEEFGMIFICLSFFLIAAAAMLVAMLFRLNIEQRARQIGLMAAVGFTPWKLRTTALLEGMVLAVIGGFLGLAGAIGYTALMVHGLNTWWIGAVGTSALRLHVRPDTLCYGLVSGIIVAFCAVLWGVWRVGRTPAARLLAGAWNAQTPGKFRSGRVTRIVGLALVVLGALVLAMIFVNIIKDPETALAGGAVLLAGALCWLAGALRPHRRAASASGLSSVTRLGVRNASRHTTRSVLSAGLIAFAVFTLVIVASMQQAAPEDTRDPKSGAGGYQLFVRASVPLLGDLDTPEGRKLLGVDESNPLWGQSHFTSMRRWAGDDISCLNLMRPTSPTILAVPHKLVEQNRFTFAVKPDDKPWEDLEKPAADGAIPVIADDQTAQYILNLPVGQTMEITDASGAKRKLKLVATLSNSIFQSELLMGEDHFRELFPQQSGFGVVLAETEPANVLPLQQLLNKELDDYGVSVDTTAARLASYNEIANTYLSTFQVLGSLGLMLGTIGLAVVLVRNVIERKPELALLAAIGFRPGDRSWLVLSENIFLLAIGLIVGAGCAILGVLPTVLSGRGAIALGPLALTLALVAVIGLGACVLAVRISGLRTTPGDLRSE